MSEPLPITIVGGGIAGLSLGILLRQYEVPVTVLDAGNYPRHRVCGEFIHGRGQLVIRQMNLLQALSEAGGLEATSTRFFNTRRAVATRNLPKPAYCISRYCLDQLLAERFQALGGVLRTNTRWRGEWAPGVVRASGRRAKPSSGGWRFIGMKMHARGLELEAHLEMHWGPHGYVGLCPVEGDRVNVCGLFRSRETVPSLARDAWEHALIGPETSPLRQRLRQADWDPDSFQSVAALSFDQGPEDGDPVFSVGDAYALIPPLTGNGMSMALESAELALGPVMAFSTGMQDWQESCRQVRSACRIRFRRRLRSARLLQALMFRPVPQTLVFALAERIQPLWNRLLKNTR